MLRRALHKPEHNWGRVEWPDRSIRWPCENLRRYDATDRNALEGKRYGLLHYQWPMLAPIRYHSPTKLPSMTRPPLEQFPAEPRRYPSIRDRTSVSRAEFRPRRSRVQLRCAPGRLV